MTYPVFFDTIEPVFVIDPLAHILGAFEEGAYTLNYTDIVKAAGHSCPTIAGAFLMARVGLQALYPDVPCVRGMVEVSFKESQDEGVTGVISHVLSHITGATHQSGFKGIHGQFIRHGLMHFNVPMQGILRLKRLDTQQTIELSYDPSCIVSDSAMPSLMQKVLHHEASCEEQKQFGTLWQKRVETILKNAKRVVKQI